MSLTSDQFMVTIVLAILTGAVFWHLSDDLTGVHNRTGLLFFVVVYFSLASTSSVGRCALLSFVTTRAGPASSARAQLMQDLARICLDSVWIVTANPGSKYHKFVAVSVKCHKRVRGFTPGYPADLLYGSS